MTGPQKKVRRSRRWLRWAGLSLLLLTGAAGFAFYFLCANLSDAAVWFANRAHTPLALELKHAQFVTKRRIEIRNLSLKLRGKRGEVLGIEKAVVDFSWRGLWENRIDAVRVENPSVFVSGNLIATPDWEPAGGKTPPSSAGGLWRVEEFNITGRKADINLPGLLPLIRFGFASDLREIYLSAEPKFSTRLQTLNIRRLEFLGKDSKPLRFGTIKSGVAHFSPERLAQNKLDELTLDAPSLWLTPALLEALCKARFSGWKRPGAQCRNVRRACAAVGDRKPASQRRRVFHGRFWRFVAGGFV